MNIQIEDQELVQQVEQLAAAEHRSPEQIVAAALRLYTHQTQQISDAASLLSIAGQELSGESATSERGKEILTELLASAPILRDLTNILPSHTSQTEYHRYLEQKYDLHE